MVRIGPDLLLIVTIAIVLSNFYAVDGALYRWKRQTVVSSNANSNGTADTVLTSGAAHNYKTVDGIIGVNVSSAGNATGKNQAGLENSASGTAGDKSINSVGNVGATGTNSNAFSNIDNAISGNNMTIQSMQQGNANGVGDTGAAATGQNVMSQGGVSSPMSSNSSKADASASGSLSSSSEVVLSQTLTWGSILAQLVGSAVAQGVYNAQANIDLGAGSPEKGVEVNGVVSGDTSGGGLVNAQVNGNGLIDNDHHQLTGNMYGNVNGTGDSNLVGASNLQSNTSGDNQSISAFGDSKTQSDGSSGANLVSNTGLDNQGKTQGEIGMNATANSGNKNMTVSNGIQVNNGSHVAVGNGGITGAGNVKTDSSINSNTKYNSNGTADVSVKADGSSAANNQSSALDLKANGDVWDTNGGHNQATANSGGAATGEHSNMTGNAFINTNGANSNGNAQMDVSAGGRGPSSAITDTGLALKDANNQTRNVTVTGSISASGDETSVRSISVISDYAGLQSLSNYQNATSKSTGSSSASASSAGILKKRRRRQVNWLSAKIIIENTGVDKNSTNYGIDH